MFAQILSFIKEDPRTSYRIAIGTDSQVKSISCFITAILVHRLGKGAIGFLKEVKIPRNIKSLREKISLETAFTQEVVYMFTSNYLELLSAPLLSPLAGSHLDLEIHLDIGMNGPTRDLIKEMVGRVSGLGFTVKIKPCSTAASSLANRYTK